MNIIRVNEQELNKHYIDSGDEGSVYRHNRRYAVKIFGGYYDKRSRLEYKMAKVKDMTSLRDSSFTFPIGLVTTNGYTSRGYYTKYIGGKKSFKDLSFEPNKEVILRYLLEAEAALKRIHKKGIMIGDLKEDNILIDEKDHPVYVDTDNYVCGSHQFDLMPMRVGCQFELYGGNIMNFMDNDKLLFALLALEKYTKDPRFRYGSTKRDIERALCDHLMTEEARDTLNCIFSDAENKPYIGSVLKKIQ